MTEQELLERYVMKQGVAPNNTVPADLDQLTVLTDIRLPKQPAQAVLQLPQDQQNVGGLDPEV